MAVTLNAEAFGRHLKSLYGAWKDGVGWNGARSLAIAAGNVSGDLIYTKTSCLHMWLLAYEFPETVLVFTEKEVLAIAGAKKIDILRQIEGAVQAAGLTFRPLPKAKGEDGAAQIETALEALRAIGEDAPVGRLADDQTGGFAGLWNKMLGESGLPLVDASEGVGRALAVKDASEITNVKKAAFLATGVMNGMAVPQIEGIIDGEKKVRQSKLAARIKKSITDPASVNVKLKQEHVDVAAPVLLQSGGKYNLDLAKGGALDDILSYDTIVCGVSASYSSYCATVARTYFVDPSDKQATVYRALSAAQAAAIAAIVDGAPFSAPRAAAVASLKAAGEEGLVERLAPSIGWSIGLEFEDRTLPLADDSASTIRSGMAFSVQIAVQDLEDEEPKEGEKPRPKFAVLLADTVVAVADKASPEAITLAVSKEWSEVAYFLEGEENEGEEEAEANAPKEEVPEVGFRKSSRSEQVDFKVREEERRRQAETQQDLLERVNAATLAAFNVGGDGAASGAGQGRKVSAITAYQSPREFASNGLMAVQVDHKAESVLVPIYGHLVPFHVLTIKNATVNQEAEHAYIRLNFNLGGSYEPSAKFPNQVFLKELSFRSPDFRRATKVVQEVKTLRSLVMQRERERAERATLVQQERLIRSKGRVYALPDVWIRPAFGGRGRRMTGALEAHYNGFRYVSPRGEELDIMYRNIKHAFFQPAEKEMITLVHFHLHNPIMVGKKKTYDVQFYTEVMDSVQTLEAGRRSAYDPDEIEDEQRERERRNAINRSFQQFVKRVQSDVWERDYPDLEFEMPFRELGFEGVPSRSTCFVMPTVNCLIELTEMPFTVITLSEVNLVNLERVGFNLRNFDMVFIWKDLNREVGRIDAIQNTSLDTIKDWLGSMEIKFYESKVNLNWRNIIKNIKEDPEGFIADGGWAFLDMSQSDSEEEEEVESEFEPTDDEEESEESESSDEESLVDSDEDDEDFSEDEDEEEGKDWDELEEEARRDDKRRQYSDDEEDRDAKRKRPNRKH